MACLTVLPSTVRPSVAVVRAVVRGVIAIIDRMEGGAQAFEKAGYPFSSLLSIRDFGIEPPKD